MTKEELIQKRSVPEWEDFDVKKAQSEVPKSVWETVSSFSNLLMLGKREAIERQFPDFRIDLLETPGTSCTDNQRYTYRIEEQENWWEYYFACFTRLRQKVDVRFSLTSEGFGQELSLEDKKPGERRTDQKGENESHADDYGRLEEAEKKVLLYLLYEKFRVRKAAVGILGIKKNQSA